MFDVQLPRSSERIFIPSLYPQEKRLLNTLKIRIFQNIFSDTSKYDFGA